MDAGPSSGANPDDTSAVRTLTHRETMIVVLGVLLPVFMGSLYESSNSWNVAMYGVVAMSFMQLLMGLIVGKPGKIEY